MTCFVLDFHSCCIHAWHLLMDLFVPFLTAMLFYQEQPKPTLFFRGQGTKMSLAERAQYDKDIHVLYQTNAWQDNETQMKYAEGVLLPYMQQRREDWQKARGTGLEAPYGIMLQDNFC